MSDEDDMDLNSGRRKNQSQWTPPVPCPPAAACPFPLWRLSSSSLY